MKVKDLMEILGKYDPEMEVYSPVGVWNTRYDQPEIEEIPVSGRSGCPETYMEIFPGEPDQEEVATTILTIR